jgi:hypothetical protein
MTDLHTRIDAQHLAPGTLRQQARARATSCVLAWVAASVILGLWSSPASAVYRCGGTGGQPVTYSQWPCSEAAQAMKVDDTRTEAQRAQAAQDKAVAEQEAARFDRRLRREARQRQGQKATAIDGPVRQVSAGDERPEERRRSRRLKAQEPDRVLRPARHFRALERSKHSESGHAAR